MREIIIDRVEDLQAGDIATMVIGGESYVGPITENDRGALFWAQTMVRTVGGTRAPMADRFVRATRELPVLPTAPLSVITDVVINGVDRHPLAIREENGTNFYVWRVLDTVGGEVDVYEDSAITSFKLAKVVEV